VPNIINRVYSAGDVPGIGGIYFIDTKTNITCVVKKITPFIQSYNAKIPYKQLKEKLTRLSLPINLKYPFFLLFRFFYN
jgi:hypothetical protein